MNTTRVRRASGAVLAVVLALTVSGCANGPEAAERRAAYGREDAFTKALNNACSTGEVVSAERLLRTPWDKMLVVPEGTLGSMVNRSLGFDYADADDYFGAWRTVFLFRKGQVVVQAGYGLHQDAPPVQLPSVGVVLDASRLQVVPQAQVSPELQSWLEEREQKCVLLSPEDTEMLQRTRL